MDQPQPLEFHVSREEIAAAFERYIHRRFPPGDLRWKRRVLRSRLKKLGEYWRRRLGSMWQRPQEPQYHVKQVYEHKWGEIHLGEQLGVEGKTSTCVWGNDRMAARRIGLKRVHQLLLIRALELA